MRRVHLLCFLILSGCGLSASSENDHLSDTVRSDSVQVGENVPETDAASPQSSPASNTTTPDERPRVHEVPREGTRKAIEFVEPPEILTNSYPQAPGVQTLTFSLSSIATPARELSGTCTLKIFNEHESRTITHPLASIRSGANGNTTSRNYQFDLFGLKPETRYQAELRFEIEGELTVPDPVVVTFTTRPVPALFPEISVRQAVPEKMEPGLTLLNLIRWENNKPDSDFGALIAVDAKGEIRWSYIASHLIFVVKQLPNGNLLYGYGNRTDGLIEIDMRGHQVRRWDATGLDRTLSAGAIPVDVDSLHHDVFPLESGNLLALSTRLDRISPYFDPSYHPRKRIENANLVTDVIVELHPDGTVLRRYPLFELLDPRRIGYGSLHNFWDSRGYEEVAGGTFDWSHCNSVCVDPADNGLLISVRHQDAVIKLDRKTGELVWILGTPKGWRGKLADKVLKPIGGVQWPFHQHAVEVTPQNTLLLFDNGNYKAVPFDKQTHASENRSRVVEFLVDEEAMTVQQVWEYDGGDEHPFYSTFLCDVDWLPDSRNVLITNGGEIRDLEGKKTDYAPGVRQWAEIYEVSYAKPVERLYDLVIQARPQEEHIGWSVYRSQRVRNLFPVTQ